MSLGFMAKIPAHPGQGDRVSIPGRLPPSRGLWGGPPALAQYRGVGRMVVVLASWPRVHHPTTPSETPSPLRPSAFFFRCWETAPPPPPVRRALALIEAELV